MGKNRNTFKAPRGEKWNKLSLIERGVYTVIACCSSFKSKKSYITRETIMKFTGIKTADQVSKYTDNLVVLGFLEKKHRFEDGKKLVIYTVKCSGKFSLVKRDIINAGLTGKQLGLYVTLAGLRFGSSNRVDLPSMYSQCGISAHTYYRFLNELIDLGYVNSAEGSIKLKRFLPLEISDFSLKLLKEMGDWKEGTCQKSVYEKIVSGDIDNIVNLDAYIQRGYCRFKKISESQLENIKNIYELC